MHSVLSKLSADPKRSQGNHLEDLAVVSSRLVSRRLHPLTLLPQVQELYDVLRTATGRAANLLNQDTPTNRLPLELLTRIFDLVGSEGHPKQIVPLTHICRHWRTVLLSYPRIWSTVYMKPGNPSIISEWLVRSQNAPLTIDAEFTDAYEHPPCLYHESSTQTSFRCSSTTTKLLSR